jgi:hypothetical protein
MSDVRELAAQLEREYGLQKRGIAPTNDFLKFLPASISP